jgi:hypothetical protein
MRAGELRAKHLARDGALDQQYRQMQELSKQFAFQPAASDLPTYLASPNSYHAPLR